VYGYRKNFDDLPDLGESCGRGRVERITCQNRVQAQVGYRKPKGFKGGAPSVVASNHLERQFVEQRPDEAWVTDITMVRTHEGWLYVAVVLNLFTW
jgi:putative transposase